MDDSQQQAFHRKALWLIAGAFLFRLVYALVYPVNLAGDEAYYWDWGRRPEFGYYSKPPVIAWLYAVVDWIGSGSLFAIRATAIVLGTLSLLVVYFLACDLFDRKTGFTAVLLSLAAPAISVLSFFLTIDAPLVLLWSISLWMVWRFVSDKDRGLSLFILFLSLGLGHLSKQMMWFFPVMIVIYLAISSDTRPYLKRVGLWISLLGSYLFLIPFLVWNSKNEWITFVHTKHHFQNAPTDKHFLLERVEKFFEFLGTQLGVLSPVTAIVVFGLSLTGLKVLKKATPAVRFLIAFCGIPLAMMIILAMRQKLQPNWPAVFYIAGIILAAAWFCGKLSHSFPPDRWRRLFKPGLIIGFFLVGFFYFGTFLFKAVGKDGNKADPNRRLVGHDVLADEFNKIRTSIPGYEEMFLSASNHRDFSSFLAFYLEDQPRVYRYEQFDRISSQYEMWPNPFEDGHAGKDGLFLSPDVSKLPRPLARSFEKFEVVGSFKVRYGYDRTREFFVIRGSGLKSWPKGRPLQKAKK